MIDYVQALVLSFKQRGSYFVNVFMVQVDQLTLKYKGNRIASHKNVPPLLP